MVKGVYRMMMLRSKLCVDEGGVGRVERVERVVGVGEGRRWRREGVISLHLDRGVWGLGLMMDSVWRER